jgi:hypothetical protein
VTLDRVVEYYEGDGWAEELWAQTRAAQRQGRRRSFDLPGAADRSWSIDVDDILQVVVKSDKDRYRRVAQASTFAGAKIPCWMAANHGRSISSVMPMRVGLHLFATVELDTLLLLGKVTHKTSAPVARGIMQCGLQNDHDKEGKLGGRIVIVADRFGRGDLAKNAYLQRADGPARVVVELYVCPCQR